MNKFKWVYFKDWICRNSFLIWDSIIDLDVATIFSSDHKCWFHALDLKLVPLDFIYFQTLSKLNQQ